MVGAGLRFQQLIATDLAARVLLPDARLFGVGHARRHGTGRHEERGQVAEAQGPGKQAGHNLVADAKTEHAIEHVMAEPDGRGLGDQVPREQRELHARLALGNAVAHGGHPGGKLGHMACPGHRAPDLLREVPVGLVCREHLVVGRDDAEVGAALGLAQDQLVGGRFGRHHMRQVGTAHGLALRAFPPRAGHQCQVAVTAGGAAFADAPGNRFNRRMHRPPPSRPRVCRHGPAASSPPRGPRFRPGRAPGGRLIPASSEGSDQAIPRPP